MLPKLIMPQVKCNATLDGRLPQATWVRWLQASREER
jgi:hypothetical protein